MGCTSPLPYRIPVPPLPGSPRSAYLAWQGDIRRLKRNHCKKLRRQKFTVRTYRYFKLLVLRFMRFMVAVERGSVCRWR
jgi:hypothetical protein